MPNSFIFLPASSNYTVIYQRSSSVSHGAPVFAFDRDLRKQNVTVNLWVVNERWLFSLLWCAGASSVTTNVCPLLREVDRPDWVMVSNDALAGHLLASLFTSLMKR